MNGKTHLATGVASVLATTYFAVQLYPTITTWPTPLQSVLAPPKELLATNAARSVEVNILIPLLAIVLIGVVAGQFPDIDQPTSTIANSGRAVGKFFRQKGVLGWLIKVLFRIINLIPQTIAWVANTFFGGHRGVIHSVLAMLVISAGVGFVSNLLLGTAFYGLLFGVGYLTHLLVDSFTKSGIGYLQPFSEAEFRLLPKFLCWKSSSPFWNAFMQGISLTISIWIIWLMLFQPNATNASLSLVTMGIAIGAGTMLFTGSWLAEIKKQQYKEAQGF